MSYKILVYILLHYGTLSYLISFLTIVYYMIVLAGHVRLQGLGQATLVRVCRAHKPLFIWLERKHSWEAGHQAVNACKAAAGNGPH